MSERKRPWSENISVLLVSTLHPGNIGSTARAMGNLGLSRLKLVHPCDHLSSEARMLAVGAQNILESARIFPSLDEALADEHVVAGTTSSRGRKLRQAVRTPREAGDELRALARSQRVCLLFGSERGGLTEEHLSRCHQLLTIPASPGSPTLNLAQAVLLVLYEIVQSIPQALGSRSSPADQQSLEAMYAQMQDSLIRIGFLSTSNPGHIMRAIRRFLSRARLTPREVRIMRGIMSQMDWFVTEGHRLPRERVEKP